MKIAVAFSFGLCRVFVVVVALLATTQVFSQVIKSNTPKYVWLLWHFRLNIEKSILHSAMIRLQT